MLILSGITISLVFGDSGIITSANKAKIMQAIGTIKEEMGLNSLDKQIEGGKVTPETLLAEGKVARTVQQAEDGNYYMYYAIKENAYPGMSGLGKGNLANLKDVFLIDDKLNIKYIASNGKEYGDNIEDKILEDETDIRFSSETFSKYVSDMAGTEEDEMKFKWMKNLKELTIDDPAVDSLQDLVFFPNLESLTLGNSENVNKAPQITTMDGVENCTKLTTLKIYYGPDKDYSAVSKLSNLTNFIRFSGTDYENIIDGLKTCKNLKTLYLRSLKINNLKLINELNNNINTIYLQNNNINKIEGLENFYNLERLYLSNNKITDITPLSANTSLKYLNLRGNSGIDGNKSNYTGERLEALNKIGEILDRGGIIYLDADKLGLFNNYTSLSLSGQNLTTLEILEGMTALTTLYISYNNITLEDEKSQEILKSMTNLKTLYLNNNPVTNITAINTLKNLKDLNLDNTTVNLVEIEDIISNLNSLTVSNESLKTITNCDINKITKLMISSSGLTEIPNLSIFNNLTELKITHNQNITNFGEISKIASLQKLCLTNDNLHGRMIDFSKLTNLTYLDLQNNTLWSEDLENLKALKNNIGLTIDLRNNSIIDASALYELNPSTKIDLRNNVNLTQESKSELRRIFGSNVQFDE